MEQKTSDEIYVLVNVSVSSV